MANRCSARDTSTTKRRNRHRIDSDTVTKEEECPLEPAQKKQKNVGYIDPR